jgi:hypothetical protein
MRLFADQGCERTDQLRDVLGRNPPQKLVPYLSVFVGQNMTLRDDLSPRDFGMRQPEGLAHAARGSAADLHMPFNGV